MLNYRAIPRSENAHYFEQPRNIDNYMSLRRAKFAEAIQNINSRYEGSDSTNLDRRAPFGHSR
jgi:hypothetical protein